MSQTVGGPAGNPLIHNQSVTKNHHRQHAHPIHGAHLNRRIQNVVSQIQPSAQDKGRLSPIAQAQPEILLANAGMPPVSGVEAARQRHQTIGGAEAILGAHDASLNAAGYAMTLSG